MSADRPDVKNDWSRGQRPVLHARCQDFNRSGIPLAVSNGGSGGQAEVVEREVEPEVEPGDAGEEGEDIHRGFFRLM